MSDLVGNEIVGFLMTRLNFVPSDCKIGEEKCDNSSCIPLQWKCDDYRDCKDGKDEETIDTDLPLARCGKWYH